MGVLFINADIRRSAGKLVNGQISLLLSLSQTKMEPNIKKGSIKQANKSSSA